MKSSFRSTQYSRLGGTGKQATRKLVFREAVENLFEVFLKQNSEAKGSQTPKRFYEIYNSPLMRSYLLATLSYFQAFLSVVSCARQLKTRKNQSSNISGEPDQEYEIARIKQREAFDIFSEFYARLLLSCSLYDQTRSEEHFFQCVFRFTLLFLQESLVFPGSFTDKSAVSSLVEQELSDILKGPGILSEAKSPADQSCLTHTRSTPAKSYQNLPRKSLISVLHYGGGGSDLRAHQKEVSISRTSNRSIHDQARQHSPMIKNLFPKRFGK